MIEIFIYILAALLYFIPSYIVWFRKVNGQQIVFWLNLLLGWTFFAWVLLIVVAMSLNPNHEKI
jgi:hypothetical protein